MPLCLAALAIRLAMLALASRTNSQIRNSLPTTAHDSACKDSPTTNKPKPTLSALVNACKRVYTSGKRIRPTVPARKKNAPVIISRDVKISVNDIGFFLSNPGTTHKGNGRDCSEKGKHQRDITQ